MPVELQVLVLGLASFVVGILSGISGGGAGLVMMPLSIAVGLPPQTAVATMKMAGLGSAFGGLSVFVKSGHVRTDIVKIMAPIAIVIGLATPFIFKSIDAGLFQNMLGIILLVMAPTLFIKKKNLHPSKHKQGLGYVLYSGILSLQALFGAGVGTLANFVLTLLFGTTKLEANATKRAVTAILAPLTFTGLLVTGFVSLPHGLALLIGSFTGTHIGSKIAVKKGEDFVTYAMVILAIVSGIWLLAS